jgi:hypothetical protein
MVFRTHSAAPRHRRSVNAKQTMRSLARLQRRVRHEEERLPARAGGFHLRRGLTHQPPTHHP